jgi:hypothetical protein
VRSHSTVASSAINTARRLIARADLLYGKIRAMPDSPESPLGALLAGFGASTATTTPVVAKVEVGAEVPAYCPSPRCRDDKVHTVISMYEDEIRRVQCTACGEVHAFRAPRGAPTAPTETPSWDAAMAGKDSSSARPYTIRETYAVGDLVQHPVFEIGVVIAVLPDAKVEIVFRTCLRILVHAR